MKNLTRKTFQFYCQHIKPYKWLFSLMCFLQIIGVIGETILPLYYKEILDFVVESSEEMKEAVATSMFGVVKMIGLIFLILFICWRVSEFIGNYIVNNAKRNIVEGCFSYLNLHSYRFFSNNFTGSLVRKVYRIIGGFETFISIIWWDFLPLVVRFVSVSVVLFLFSPLLSGILLLWILIFVIINIFLALWQYPLDTASYKADSQLGAFIADVITNQLNVKLFTSHQFELDAFRKKSELWYRKTQRSWNLGAKINLFQSAFMFAIELLMIIMTIFLWKNNVVSIGFFILIQSYLTGLFIRLWDFRRIIHNLFNAFADAEEMTEILNTPHEIRDIYRAKPLRPMGANIEFNHVTFGYIKETPILRNFCLKIRSGKKVAFVGHSGEGKSTITKLLMRLFDIQRGAILYDGQNIAQVTLESLRSNVSLVPQEPILFHRSLLENICYGNRNASKEEVLKASTLSHCHEFILKLKDGYQTLVGERGIKLSGGEKQRIAIARAILENAPLVILDEATSSLDSHSERLIQEALHRLLKGKTAIIIAHRLSTIMACDRIIVMEGGKIVETGKHLELLKKPNGIYSHLWKIQAGGFIGEV